VFGKVVSERSVSLFFSGELDNDHCDLFPVEKMVRCF
jgi:hypothetical protein